MSIQMVFVVRANCARSLANIVVAYANTRARARAEALRHHKIGLDGGECYGYTIESVPAQLMADALVKYDERSDHVLAPRELVIV